LERGEELGRATVAVSGDLFGGGAGFQLLVGYTRLGNLLGMLDSKKSPKCTSILFGSGAPFLRSKCLRFGEQLDLIFHAYAERGLH
jgi:hypothetical protein